jgi:hypothetical protein
VAGDIVIVCSYFTSSFPTIPGLTPKKSRGFLSSDNMFLTREEAAVVALSSGQVKNLRHHGYKLYDAFLLLIPFALFLLVAK